MGEGEDGELDPEAFAKLVVHVGTSWSMADVVTASGTSTNG
jgi:hypothetical protein